MAAWSVEGWGRGVMGKRSDGGVGKRSGRVVEWGVMGKRKDMNHLRSGPRHALSLPEMVTALSVEFGRVSPATWGVVMETKQSIMTRACTHTSPISRLT